MPVENIPLCVAQSLRTRRGIISRNALPAVLSAPVGPFVEKFESEFARWTGSKYAVACASGTAAIHLALQAVGVGAGDFVLTSDFTFIATANPVVYLGATPGFIDNERSGWNYGSRSFWHRPCTKTLGERHAAACRYRRPYIWSASQHRPDTRCVCDSYEIPVVEDATEALGARYTANYPHAACRNRSAGSVGKLGCFSFNGNKLITTGGGGMVTTDDPALAAWVKHVSCQAKQPGVAFVHDQVGYNYRLTNLAAALGCAQLGADRRFHSQQAGNCGAISRVRTGSRISVQMHTPRDDNQRLDVGAGHRKWAGFTRKLLVRQRNRLPPWLAAAFFPGTSP